MDMENNGSKCGRDGKFRTFFLILFSALFIIQHLNPAQISLSVLYLKSCSLLQNVITFVFPSISTTAFVVVITLRRAELFDFEIDIHRSQ
jgi:hypothetical protein